METKYNSIHIRMIADLIASVFWYLQLGTICLPSESVEYTVIVTAADKENAIGLGVFKLTKKE